MDELVPNNGEIWKQYAQSRPWISRIGPATEAARVLVQKREILIKDMEQWRNHEGWPTIPLTELDEGFRFVIHRLIVLDYASYSNTTTLFGSKDESKSQQEVVLCVLEYLTHRVCVPRDVGPLSAAAIYKLKMMAAGVGEW